MNTSLASLSSRSSLTTTSVSRRSLFKLGLGGALGIGLAASGLSLLGSPALTVSAALPAFQAYHGVNGATHQAKFDSLSSTGYRMISLSIYGDPNDPRYAAVWVQKPGGAYIAMHGITADEYQNRFNSATAQGYTPVLVSATGLKENARFAAVFEQGIQGDWVARHGMPYAPESDPNSYVAFFESMRKQGYTPRSFSVYGGFEPGNHGDLGLPALRVWAAVFHKTTTANAPWLFSEIADATTYQQDFDNVTSRGYRPGVLAVTFDAQYAGMFPTGPSIGSWIARHNLTADQYQQAFNDATAKGYIPINVQGGGTGNNTRYAAIFATQLP